MTNPISTTSPITQSLNPASQPAASVLNQDQTPGQVSFQASLESQSLQTAAKTRPQADFVSGRLGIDLDSRGQVGRMVYLDANGNRLTSSSFNAKNILQKTEQYGIPLEDLRGLGQQLDAQGIGYKPYMLYKTGSDHGIDFDDLINGGLGTAYDWRTDANLAAKGPQAASQQEDAKALAERLGLQANPQVTTQKTPGQQLLELLNAGINKPTDPTTASASNPQPEPGPAVQPKAPEQSPSQSKASQPGDQAEIQTTPATITDPYQQWKANLAERMADQMLNMLNRINA